MDFVILTNLSFESFLDESQLEKSNCKSLPAGIGIINEPVLSWTILLGLATYFEG